MPLFGPPNIESMESRGDTAGLIKALTDKDLGIRRKAVHALGKFTNQPAVMDALILDITDHAIGSDVIRVLGMSGNPRAFEPLRNALNTDYCIDAAEALGLLRDQRACPELRKVADHGGRNERTAAIKALSILGDPYTVDLILHELKTAPFDPKADLVQKLSRFNDPRITDDLLDLSLDTGVSGMYSDLDKRINKEYNYGLYSTAQEEIRSKEKALQKEIRSTLTMIALNAKEPLIEALNSQNSQRRKIASEVLNSIGWTPSSPDMEMKQWVINNQWEKFIEAGSAAFDFLITVLQDSTPDNPGHAAQALAKLHDKRAVKSLIDALLEKKSGWSTLRIIEALAELEAVESIEPMLTILKSQMEANDLNQVRYSKEIMEKCLLKFHSLAVPQLTKMLNGDNHLNQFIIEILGKIGEPSAIPALLPQLNSDNLDVLTCTAETLKKLQWQPTQDDTGAKYYTYNQQWAQCSELGEKAVPALLSVFRNKFDTLYQGAAGVLKQLYRGGNLSPESTAQILTLNGIELRSHNDGESLSTCTHTDEAQIVLEL